MRHMVKRILSTRLVKLSLLLVLLWNLTSLAPAVSYPENHLEVMQTWGVTPTELKAALSKMKLAFNQLPLKDTRQVSIYIHQLKQEVPYDGQKETQLERQNVIFILERMKDLYDAYDALQHEEYASALNLLKRWESLSKKEAQYPPDLISGNGIYPKYYKYRLAFWDGTYIGLELAPPMSYWGPQYEKYWKNSPPPVYTGQNISGAIRVYKATQSRFRAFNLRVLYAEIYMTLGTYEKAEEQYWYIMGGELGDPCATPQYDPIEGTTGNFQSGITLSATERDYTAIRRGFNFLAWGDRLFKRAHNLSSSDKQAALKAAKQKYNAALCLFPNTQIGKQIDQKIQGLNTLENNTLQKLGSPNVSVKMAMPLALVQPLDVPMVPGELLKPTAKMPSTTGVPRAPIDEVQARASVNPLIEGFETVPAEKIQEAQSQTTAPAQPQMQEPQQVTQPSVQVEELETYQIPQAAQATAPLDQVQPAIVLPVFTADLLPQENPVVIEIIAHAKMQILKIEKQLNYLGYFDGYVPEQRYSFLYSRANEYADMTVQTETRYLQFKKQAEDQEYQSRQLEQNAQITAYQEQIAQTRRQIADDRGKQADLKMKQIDEKIAEIRSSGFWNFLGGALSMMAGVVGAPFTGGASVAAGVLAYGAFTAGQIGQAISDDHEIAALQYQKQAVAVDKVIAGREGVIADLEGTIAQMQGAFIQSNLQYLSNKELNQDTYYALAKTLKRVKQAYLDAGIRMGYLAERALAFDMDQPDLQFIKFDYERADLKNLLAGDFLKQDLLMMEYNRALALKQRNHIKHVISLRQRYPMEFSRLLQTGQMDFTTGLYEFDKAYPGTYQRRLKRIEVAIQGLVGPEGFKGNLTNFGSFIVRNRQGSLNSHRLIPTSQEFKNAYDAMKKSGLSAMRVGGVTAYQLPSARLVLSKYDIRQDGVIFPAEMEVRETFEGFGLSGLWRLALPKYINDVDYRTIADVQLVLYFDAYYDPDIEKKIGGYYDSANKQWVQGLVEQYEQEVSGGQQLDQLAMFSLRQHFPDEFFSFSGGEVTFELLDGDFPLYMTQKKIKKVIVQVVDRKGNGIQAITMEVAKLANSSSTSPALSLTETTLADGYTMDLNLYKTQSAPMLPATQRVPVVGTWRIKLADATQASKIDDLFVIFLYDYKENRAHP